MSFGLLFVTAASADVKVINRLLLHLHDWEFGSGDRFILVLDKSADTMAESGQLDQRKHPPETKPPLQSVSNDWAGTDIEDVEAYVNELRARDMKHANPSLFVLLDEQGISDKTCVVAQIVFDQDADVDAGEEFRLDVYNKVRVPWDQTYIVWCNLDIGNAGFEEYTEEGQNRQIGLDEDERKKKQQDEGMWWTCYTMETLLSDENRGERDAEIAALEEKDLA